MTTPADRVINFLEILEEHASEAEKDENMDLLLMLETFRDALYAARVPDSKGRLTITLDLTKEAR